MVQNSIVIWLPKLEIPPPLLKDVLSEIVVFVKMILLLGPLATPPPSPFCPETSSDCELAGVKSLESSVHQPVVSDIPVLALSGAFDPITPP